MSTPDLKERLLGATDYRAWVPMLEAYFSQFDLFYGHGTDNAADEAYWLVAAALDWDEANWTAPPTMDLVEQTVRLAERRVTERVPLAYLLGEAWFAGLRFAVNESVLIPRSPLAELIERGLEPWCRPMPGDRVLEIGTGSGCIAIALAHYLPQVRIDATELSSPALDLARSNVARHGQEDRVRLLEADLFPREPHRYRAIIANPPYVPEGRLATLPAEYRHEPQIALAAGQDGLDVVRRILSGSRERLEADGVLIVEVGESADALTESFPELGAIWVEFEHGGTGVFVVTTQDLADAGF